MALPEHLKTGMRGEQLAARALRDRGDTVLTAGFRTQLGETDIISLTKDKTLCFVEVKTRSPGGMFPPADAVDREKQARLVNNAAAYVKAVKLDYRAVRFDIVEVILHDLTHADINIITDAFGQEYFPAVKKESKKGFFGRIKDRER